MEDDQTEVDEDVDKPENPNELVTQHELSVEDFPDCSTLKKNEENAENMEPFKFLLDHFDLRSPFIMHAWRVESECDCFSLSVCPRNCLARNHFWLGLRLRRILLVLGRHHLWLILSWHHLWLILGW